MKALADKQTFLGNQSMSKYSDIYIDEINKKAFFVPAVRAGIAAAKPILAQGMKQSYNTAKPILSSAITKGFNMAKPVASRATGIANDFMKGSIQGLQSMASGYRGIASSNAPLKNKIFDIGAKTFSAPWDTAKATLKGKSSFKNLSAKDIGTVFGTAIPGLTLNNAIDSSIDAIPEPQEELGDSNSNLWEDINNRSSRYR